MFSRKLSNKLFIKFLIGIIVFINISSCSVKQKEIEYGVDNCAFCDMTIIDNKHSAELVTDKGKVFMFDAIECMLRYIDRNDAQIYSLQLIADYSIPGNLIDASMSTYLICQNIPSPMGEFLSGFKSTVQAQSTLDLNGGKLYNWVQINSAIIN